MSEIAYCTTIIALSIVSIVAIVGVTIYNMEKVHLKLEGNAKLRDATAIGLKMNLSNESRNDNCHTEEN